MQEHYLQEYAELLHDDTVAKEGQHNNPNYSNPSQHLKKSRVPPNRIPLIHSKIVKPINTN